MTATAKEAERRLDELVETVERLLTTSTATTPQIQNDIQPIDYRLETFDRSGAPF